MSTAAPRKSLPRPLGILLSLTGLLLMAFLAPAEKTLGFNIRLVYLHGVWVWTGLAMYFLAGLAGLVGLLGLWNKLNWLAARKEAIQRASLALGRTALLFWLTYLPMSLLVMQINWGGMFFDEPRWRIPFMIAIAETIVQIALALFDNLRLTAAVNLLFAVGIAALILPITSVLHPNSPVFSSDSISIQVYFLAMLALALLTALQIAAWLFKLTRKPQS